MVSDMESDRMHLTELMYIAASMLAASDSHSATSLNSCQTWLLLHRMAGKDAVAFGEKWLDSILVAAGCNIQPSRSSSPPSLQSR
jgi:hypothetical protein